MSVSIIVVSEIADEKQKKKLEKIYEKIGVEKCLIFILKCGRNCEFEFEHYCLEVEQGGVTREDVTSDIVRASKCIDLAESSSLPFGFSTLQSLGAAQSIKIAYLAIKQNGGDYSNLLSAVDTDGVDILLTNDWPSGITSKSDLATSMHISQNDASYSQSQLVNEFILKCRPRYHFAYGSSKRFFEREPFTIANPDTQVTTITRFIGLASPLSTAADKAEKCMYAFSLQPKSDTLPPKGVVTACPFHLEKKRSAEDEFHQDSYFWNDTSVKRIKKEDVDGVPPASYICKICNTPGHYVHKCPQNKTEMPSGYICRICGIPGHYIRDCPKNTDQSRLSNPKSLKKRDLHQCWFCLSNPQVESHMVLGIVEECYVALAKGAVTDQHVLVVPVLHHISSTVLKTTEEGGRAMHEVHAILEKMNVVQKGHGNGIVYFEVFGGGDPQSNPNVRLSHMHVNCIPLPSDQLETFHDVVAQEAEKAGLVQSTSVPETNAWPFIRIGVVEGREMVYSPPKPKSGRPLAPFDLAFARGIVCEMLGVGGERRNWKSCVKGEEEETESTDSLRKLYSFLVEDD